MKKNKAVNFFNGMNIALRGLGYFFLRITL
jgi:hypothetical protein